MHIRQSVLLGAAAVLILGGGTVFATAATATPNTPVHAAAVRVVAPGVVSSLPKAPARIRLPKTHLPHPRVVRNGAATSDNWSGYADVADSGVTFTRAATEFTVPNVNCAGSALGPDGAYIADWIGIDGWADTTVEQTGIQAWCDSATGPVTYVAWYEMYPLDPVVEGTVSPGDAISVSVRYSGGTYYLDLTDVNTGEYADATATCPAGNTCARRSAEAITEDPGGAVPDGINLADYGWTAYGESSVTAGGTTGNWLAVPKKWTSEAIAMVDPDNGGKVMSAPGPAYASSALWTTFKASS